MDVILTVCDAYDEGCFLGLSLTGGPDLRTCDYIITQYSSTVCIGIAMVYLH